MKLAYSFTADIHAVNAEGELTYMLRQDVPFEGELSIDITAEQRQWLDECQRDGVDEAFWDLFGKAIRQRHSNLGDMFNTEYKIIP